MDFTQLSSCAIVLWRKFCATFESGATYALFREIGRCTQPRIQWGENHTDSANLRFELCIAVSFFFSPIGSHKYQTQTAPSYCKEILKDGKDNILLICNQNNHFRYAFSDKIFRVVHLMGLNAISSWRGAFKLSQRWSELLLRRELPTNRTWG